MLLILPVPQLRTSKGPSGTATSVSGIAAVSASCISAEDSDSESFAVSAAAANVDAAAFAVAESVTPFMAVVSASPDASSALSSFTGE